VSSAGGTLTIHSGADTMLYVKIGRTVWIQGQLQFSTATSPTGAFTLLGLPFTVGAHGENADASCFTVGIDSLNSAVSGYCCGFVLTGYTTMLLRESGLTTNGADLAYHIDTGTVCYITGSFTI